MGEQSAAGRIPDHDEPLRLWLTLCREARLASSQDGTLARMMEQAILSHPGFAEALAHRISVKLANVDMDGHDLFTLALSCYREGRVDIEAAVADLIAIRDRDPSSRDLLTPFLYFKGFMALQAHRIAHALWSDRRPGLARHIQSRSAEVFAIDIHPAARMGRGIMLDHGTGLVIGETAVVEDDVSILQSVTLGGTGKDSGDRHPKVRRGALIGAGAKILGNIEIGIGAKVGAGSVVVTAVAPHTSVAGVPARPIGRPATALPGVSMEADITEPDYVI